MFIFALTILADMVKLVDMPDLGSGAARRVGSSPIIRTKKKLPGNGKLFLFKLIFLLIKKCSDSTLYSKLCMFFRQQLLLPLWLVFQELKWFCRKIRWLILCQNLPLPFLRRQDC